MAEGSAQAARRPHPAREAGRRAVADDPQRRARDQRDRADRQGRSDARRAQQGPRGDALSYEQGAQARAAREGQGQDGATRPRRRPPRPLGSVTPVRFNFQPLEDFVKKNVFVTAAAVLMVAVAGPGMAQTQAAPAAPAAPLPQVAQAPKTPPFVTTGPRVDLSIEEAVARARDRNIDIGVARITPRLTDFTIAGLEANYRPNVTSTVANRSNTQAVTNQTQGATGNSLHTGTVSWQGGFAQNMKGDGGAWNAGRAELRVCSSNLLPRPQPASKPGVPP